MSEDLQGLLEKINRDGVEKANATAEKIISDAKAKASEIIATAKEEAAKLAINAEKTAEDYQSRARETLAQAARDTVLKVEESVTKMLETLLAKNVNRELANPDVVATLIRDALATIASNKEIATNEKIASSLKSQFASEKDIKIITDETLGTGFSVRIDNGRIEHAFTGNVIASELAKRLRPDLASLLK